MTLYPSEVVLGGADPFVLTGSSLLAVRTRFAPVEVFLLV